MLFEPKERTALNPKGWVEGSWNYLDRSGRKEAQQVRDFLEHWVAKYPAAHRKALIGRIQLDKDDLHESATFELIVFALLRSLGCEVTVEPELPNGSAKRPDFLAVTPTGEPVYVEAKLAFEEGLPERVAQRQVNEIYAAIEKLRCPNFSINVEVVAQSAVQPGGGTLRKHLREWIATLDPDTEFQKIAASRNLDDLPTTQWQHEDWIIDFEAMARPPERRDEARRVVGIQTGSAYLMNSWKPIRRAIEKKGGRYDLLPHPLLVAVNLNNFSIDPADEMQALFGQDEVAVYREGDTFLPTVQRKADGVWVGKFTRVSGAWVFADVTPWNVARQRSTIYFNPWAAKPLPPMFSTLYHAATEGNEMQWKEGRSMREVLGLPEDWPRSNG